MTKGNSNRIDLWDGEFLTATRSRRDFLAHAGAGICVLPFLEAPAARAAAATAPPRSPQDDPYVREARHYRRIEEQRVECLLCPRRCRVADLERGYCGVRENRGGTYYTLVYSRVVALHIDPIEKKPLFHYHPGQQALSLATVGCNIECDFCQNWNISQFRPEQVEASTVTPQRMVQIARERRVPHIAFTYSEPVIFYEYMADIAAEGNGQGIGSVMISNGYILEQPLRELVPLLAAVKIDLKAFTESFYRDTCSGELQPVLTVLKLLSQLEIWFEIVVLIVPTLNDSPDEIRQMARWIMGELGPDVPVHFTRFHPTYKITNLPATPVGTLERCHGIAREEGLHFVYCGNVPGHPAESTVCPGCDRVVIRRYGFSILENHLQDGNCAYCGRAIPGVW